MKKIFIKVLTLDSTIRFCLKVKWANDNLDGYLNLYSIAGDGRVTNWTIVKTALWYTDTLSITFSQILQNLSKEDTKDNLKGKL